MTPIFPSRRPPVRHRLEEGEPSAELRALFELSPAGLALCDVNGHILKANPRWQALCPAGVEHLGVAGLPEEWQRMLELRKTHSMVQVSELMGVPRSTLRHWMSQIAEQFEAEGLREYIA